MGGFMVLKDIRATRMQGSAAAKTTSSLPEGNKAMAPSEQSEGTLSPLCHRSSSHLGRWPQPRVSSRPGRCKLLPDRVGSETQPAQDKVWSDNFHYRE